MWCFTVRGSWRPNINCNILTPLLWPSCCVCLVFLMLNWRPRGSLCWVLASFTASYQQLLWTQTRQGPKPLRPGVAFPTWCVHQGTIRMHLLSSQHNRPSIIPWRNFKTLKGPYSGPSSWSQTPWPWSFQQYISPGFLMTTLQFFAQQVPTWSNRRIP